jgi:hypothetical protein
MPVTAKLSKHFYDRLGEQIANELVEWFNQVDATYRSDLRDINELNFARFDAKLKQRLTQQDAKLEQGLARLDAKIGSLRLELQDDFHSLQIAVERALRDQTRWMFVMWSALLIPIIGLWFR